MTTVDLLIQHGRVIDPENNIDAILEVAVQDGKVFAVGERLDVNAKEVYDATDCLVTPGLIDAHVHCYEYATPLGINPDVNCLARGCTTVIDAGSAGATTFLGLKKYIIEKSKTRVKCLLHIALHGLAASGCAGWAPGGESDTLAILNEQACKDCIESNRDVIVGVKVRLSANVCAEGKTEFEAYRRALAVAESCHLPLMVHHAKSTVPTQKTEDSVLSCPGDLRPGDIYTHTYHGFTSSIIDEKTRGLHSDVIDARSRGVLFDVGHGAGAFDWTVAEIATKQGLWPDMLGSDLHTQSVSGPAYDLPIVMTKFLHLGMPLTDIIRSVTSTCARAYGLDACTGSLTPGKEADIAVLKIIDCDVALEDSIGQSRNIRKRIIPVAVWRAGASYPIDLPSPWPNPKAKEQSLKQWDGAVVKDDERPRI